MKSHSVVIPPGRMTSTEAMLAESADRLERLEHLERLETQPEEDGDGDASGVGGGVADGGDGDMSRRRLMGKQEEHKYIKVRH